MALGLFGGFEIVYKEVQNYFMGRVELDLEVLIVNLGGSVRLLPLLLNTASQLFLLENVKWY